MRNVKRRLRVTLRLQVPLRSPVSVVYFPRGEGAQLVRLLHVIEKRQHLAELGHSVGRHAFSVVLRVEPFQALMDNVPYFHAQPSVACNLTLVKASRRRSDTISSLVLLSNSEEFS